MAGKNVPQLVIGVDFGMTLTGVAYCAAPNWTTPKTFQQWGPIVGEIANKVPSRVSYSRETGQVVTWGFSCVPDDMTSDLKEYFKLYLDPEYHDEYLDMPHTDAKRFFRDFLTCVHDHVAHYFQSRLPQWTSQTVEWVFSVPTTWRNPGNIYSLERLIGAAGFGKDGPNHSCKITLTEAEAAAISVARQQLKRDDVILVCDAGGGTTDVNILKLMSSEGAPIRLQPLLKVEGKPVGSALIDIRVQQLLEERLRHISHRLPASPIDTAEIMMHGRFERFKCAFGTSAYDMPQLFLRVPGLPPGTDYPLAGVANSQIGITRELLQEIFDEQVEEMINLIDDQIKALQRWHSGEQISYLIMSGGLGSSEYVKTRLKSYYRSGAGAGLPNAQGMQLLLAEDPQLSVVHGLVLNRAQEIGVGVTPIRERCARVSYGLVINQPYNPEHHIGEKVVKDPRDRKRWAVGQVDWLIRQGDIVAEEGVSKRFKAKLQPAQLRRPWKAQFVMSAVPREQLPSSIARDSVKNLCIIEAKLDNISKTIRNHHWWNLGTRYELAVFDVKLIPGSADLKFQLLNNNRIVNDEQDSVEVTWEAAKSKPSPELSELDHMFRA